MINKPCSKKHFKRLANSFERIAKSQIKSNKHLDKYHDLIESLIDGNLISESPYDRIIELLIKNYNMHPYKTMSMYDDVMTHRLVNKFWVGYTMEDKYGKRIHKSDISNESYMVFKIYMQIGHYKKRRIARWKVKMDWYKNN